MAKDKVIKASIVESISEEIELSKENIKTVIDLVFSHLKEALGSNQTIELRGFGTFEVRTRKGRDNARNPSTGQTVKVGDHGVVIFRPGRELKDIAWPLC